MAAELVINGVDMPDPAINGGLTYAPEKIWSKNTGRVSDGEMFGDIVARKMTLKIKWIPHRITDSTYRVQSMILF